MICGMVYDQCADDSIRVTVVATGLSGEVALSLASVDREPVSTPRMPTLKPVVATDAPSFQATKQPPMRTGQQQMQPQAFDQPGFNDDEYAVPTFLRRQADERDSESARMHLLRAIHPRLALNILNFSEYCIKESAKAWRQVFDMCMLLKRYDILFLWSFVAVLRAVYNEVGVKTRYRLAGMTKQVMSLKRRRP